MRRQKIPGFALGVVDDGRIVYERGFGVLSVKTRAALDVALHDSLALKLDPDLRHAADALAKLR